MSAPATACESAACDELLDGGVVGDLVSPVASILDEDAAMPVRRVLAQADVGDDDEVADLALDRAHRALHRRVRIARARAAGVLSSTEARRG